MAWDAVIVGSGFGGACSALALTEAGLRVLLLERGRPVRRDEGDWDPAEILLGERYRSSSPVRVRQYGARRYTDTYQHEVVGGSSVFYGGASLRLRPADMAHWPLDYEDLAPHYERAEALLGVHGEAGSDPCEPPRAGAFPYPAPALTAPAQRIYDAGRRLGLQPFPLPMALNFTDPTRPRCILCNTCDGFPCRIEAKNDLTATVLKQAQARGLEIRAGAVASRIRTEELRSVGVDCIDAHSGETVTFDADRVLVAAGALHSPALLLRSGLERSSPGGEWIGRRLMRHCNAVVAGVFLHRTNPEQVFHKQLCFTDFYEEERDRTGRATGTIQDIYTPAAQVIRRHAPAGLRRVSGWLSGRMQNLLCIAEDEPRRDNTVSLGTERDALGLAVPRVDHAYAEADLQRRGRLTEQAARVLREAGARVTRLYEIDSFSHAVGSVGMGTTPDDSAVDAGCRIWGTENVWVVDGSCFPASAGVNPSLTIAANALRVAAAIAGDLPEERRDERD